MFRAPGRMRKNSDLLWLILIIAIASVIGQMAHVRKPASGQPRVAMAAVAIPVPASSPSAIDPFVVYARFACQLRGNWQDRKNSQECISFMFDPSLRALYYYWGDLGRHYAVSSVTSSRLDEVSSCSAVESFSVNEKAVNVLADFDGQTYELQFVLAGNYLVTKYPSGQVHTFEKI